MVFTVASRNIENMLIEVFLYLLTLCWLSERHAKVAEALWNAIVQLRNAWQVIELKGKYTTVINEGPFVEEPELSVPSSDQAGDQTPDSLPGDLVSPSFPIYFIPSPQQDEKTVQTNSKYTTVINEDPVVKEPEFAAFSSDQAADQTPGSLPDDFVSPPFPVYFIPSSQQDEKTAQTNSKYTTVINKDPAVEEPEFAAFSSDQAADQTPDSLPDDLVSPPFPVYFIPSPQQDEKTAQTIKEAMETVMRVIDLTIKGVQPVEKCINYLEFVFFDLNLGKDMFTYVHWHMFDQLNWWHYHAGDPQLDIVGKLYGGLIARGIRLNLPDDWHSPAWMIICHLKNDDIHYLNFARSAYEQIKKDLPPKYSYLIQRLIDEPRKTVRKKSKRIVIPAYAVDYKYL